ncbi:hypothetical protein AB595_25140 [Massilia sp. WF1]|uniref:DUF4124 domain-containing protein n=1 Tax=unclassified Massilia TaxID=2609279 RepID=UPI00068F5C71|nr:MULTISPECIES: DUF4124 domain-containing protein [unclassified Massilia]ALK97644.1 hypothetical protein AM586_16910 [Massilia sp. WG5]KNZ67776.1 hypothetical protein AB595_25140 [Massilia sp. WF1]
MKRQWPRLLCAGALALTSLFAHAQYSWIDDKGTRVFSDRPPPPGTPPARILKTPRGLEPREPQPEPAAPAEKQAAPDWKQRETDYRKRAEKRSKEEEEALAANKARAAECDTARVELARLNSGARLVRIDKNGEHDYLSDEERAQRQEKARRRLAQCP